MRSYRWQLTPGEDTVDVATWAGSVPHVNGIAPRVRIGRSRWFNLLWLLPIGFVLLLIAVAAAKGLRDEPAVQRFIARNPGTVAPSHPDATTGIPAWARWQHFLNLFFLSSSSASGVQILSDHPRLYWTRHRTPGRDWFRIQNPVPADPLWTAKQDSISLPGQVGLPGLRHSIGLARWWHLGVDTAVAAQRPGLLRPAVRHRPLAAARADELGRVPQRPVGADPVPLAGLAGRERLGRLQRPAADRLLRHRVHRRAAGAGHRAGHVTGAVDPLQADQQRAQHPDGALAALPRAGLVPALHRDARRRSCSPPGLLVNLNHVYAGRTDGSWAGFWLFAASMAIVTVGWVAATPFTLRHPRVVQRVGYALIGPVQRLFEHVDAKPGQYTEKDISPYFWHNGQYPDSDEYKALLDGALRRLPAAHRRPGRQPRRARPGAAASAAPPRADHPALLHPGLVGHRQVGRRVDADDRRPRPAAARRRSGSSSTPSATERTRASTTTPTRSSTCPTTSRCSPTT